MTAPTPVPEILWCSNCRADREHKATDESTRICRECGRGRGPAFAQVEAAKAVPLAVEPEAPAAPAEPAAPAAAEAPAPMESDDPPCTCHIQGDPYKAPELHAPGCAWREPYERATAHAPTEPPAAAPKPGAEVAELAKARAKVGADALRTMFRENDEIAADLEADRAQQAERIRALESVLAAERDTWADRELGWPEIIHALMWLVDQPERERTTLFAMQKLNERDLKAARTDRDRLAAELERVRAANVPIETLRAVNHAQSAKIRAQAAELHTLNKVIVRLKRRAKRAHPASGAQPAAAVIALRQAVETLDRNIPITVGSEGHVAMRAALRAALEGAQPAAVAELRRAVQAAIEDADHGPHDDTVIDTQVWRAVERALAALGGEGE